jgi:hypothetical protein
MKHRFGPVEKKLLANSIFSFAIISIIQLIILYLLFGGKWLAARTVWLLALNLAAVSSVASISHLKAHGSKTNCMTGMMLGMIAGMQAGMLTGYVLGATNGFFAGALASTMFGMAVGYLAGKSGTTMGAIQGAMAGFMGGAMGAMTSVMMVGWGFPVFTGWFLLANFLLFWTFHLLVVEEFDQPEKTKMPFPGFLLYSILLSSILSAILVLGPRGLIF